MITLKPGGGYPPNTWVGAQVAVLDGYAGSYRGDLSACVTWSTWVPEQNGTSNCYNGSGNFAGFIGGELGIGSAYQATFASQQLTWNEWVDYGPGGPDRRASNHHTNQQLDGAFGTLSSSTTSQAGATKDSMTSLLQPGAAGPQAVTWQEESNGELVYVAQ
jgi:hypothetical protein